MYALFTCFLQSKSNNLTFGLLPGEFSVLLFTWNQLVAGIDIQTTGLYTKPLGEVERMYQCQYCDITLCVRGISALNVMVILHQQHTKQLFSCLRVQQSKPSLPLCCG